MSRAFLANELEALAAPSPPAITEPKPRLNARVRLHKRHVEGWITRECACGNQYFGVTTYVGEFVWPLTENDFTVLT